ncbi:MAG: DNA translocase FtsK [Gammaproteobacteria bacterium]|nr:MAG: DNA translocase FtsK [Gammaproteobacteria bacterium]
MAQAIPRKGEKAEAGRLHLRLREAALILATGLCGYLLIALFSYDPQDPGWSHSGGNGRIHNHAGPLGAWLADVMLYLFGWPAYLFPLMVLYSGWLVYRGRDEGGAIDYFHIALRAAGFVLIMMMSCGLAWLRLGAPELPLQQAGGILGEVTGGTLYAVLGSSGAPLLMLILLMSGITLFTGFSWLWLVDTTGALALRSWERMVHGFDQLRDLQLGLKARKARETVVRKEKERIRKQPKPRIEPVISEIEPAARVEKEKQASLFVPASDSVLPPLKLLDSPVQKVKGYSRQALEAMSRQVELKLADFGISVTVEAVHPGPVITRFELQPAPGVKVSQIANLSKDLARALSTVSVRVVDIIPGKSVIGLEIPNEQRELVYLAEILNSRQFEQSRSHLSLVLGKDIGGAPVVADLARMPHLLVAGTTGSGKSVALNAMIMSLVYKSPPADVRLIMIDPKMLELSVYEGIPHLLAPVVTDMKEAANALRWCVGEMERRYRLMATLGVRNITGLNRKIQDAAKRNEPLRDPLWEPAGAEEEERSLLEPMPYIVVVVDELADLMMVVGKKVEELIARLAQKARASGIHLILATQRPSVDVITGLIKANIPCRIAFQVSSRVDSRTILDQMGAETLLGNGDMLYLAPGTGLPVRVHGAFVSDQEVHRVVDYLKEHGSPDYVETVLAGATEDEVGIPGLGNGDHQDLDPLYDQAVRIVTETRRASVSGVQRRLKIGYNRAARLVEQMEREGVVGELQPNGSREVLAPPPPVD